MVLPPPGKADYLKEVFCCKISLEIKRSEGLEATTIYLPVFDFPLSNSSRRWGNIKPKQNADPCTMMIEMKPTAHTIQDQ